MISRGKIIHDVRAANFCITRNYCPLLSGLNAETYDFATDGNEEETSIGYVHMLSIVNDAAFSGYVGIESMHRLTANEEWIPKTKAMLGYIETGLGDITY